VAQLFAQEAPEYVIIAAAKVGGIQANVAYPAAFAYDNLMIGTNLIHAAHQYGVRKTLVLGSSCIYPRAATQPIDESSLLTGALEETNKPYAVAKIATLVLAQSYARQYGMRIISAMPTNLYGPGDALDSAQAHVIPALIMKIMDAHHKGIAEVAIGGSGSALREFLYVDDCAQALIHLLACYEDVDIINVGSPYEVSIAQLAQLIAERIGYAGTLVWDCTFPEGTPRKKLNTQRMTQLGWQAHTSLQVGLDITIGWYHEQYERINARGDCSAGRCSRNSMRSVLLP
jgi:GDP-L-fucose synthase